MQQIEADVARRAAASRYGIEVLDLRIWRADLPEANRDAVYRRMASDRQREAATLRATGEREAARIRADATKLGDTIRGEGDAERAKIFADSFGKDASFAAFFFGRADAASSAACSGVRGTISSGPSLFALPMALPTG